MVKMLPDDRFRPPDPSTVLPTPNIHHLLPESSSASSYNSSKDELDPDNQSMDGSDEDVKDTMKHTDQVVGSTFRDTYSDVQIMTEQQGLSPRGKKQT
uniref:Uncharacterized protein n=1 Tax=Solanum tuberosum TaxID=4113 RepID=M1DGK9_SOLTU